MSSPWGIGVRLARRVRIRDCEISGTVNSRPMAAAAAPKDETPGTISQSSPSSSHSSICSITAPYRPGSPECTLATLKSSSTALRYSSRTPSSGMVVDSTISAPGRAYWRTSSWTRLLAQTTTSASPMSLAPLTVSKSSAPGPAPINHTLPKLRTPPGKDHCGEICTLAPHHLQSGHDFFALDPQPRPVHRALQPPSFLSDPEHLPQPATALVADHRLEPGERLPQGLRPCRERQQRQPLVAFEEYRPTPRSQVLQRRDPWHSLYLNVRFDLPNGPCQVGEGRIHVGVSDSGERARLATPQVLRDSLCRVRPVTLPDLHVVREGEEEAFDPPFVQILAHRGLGPPDLAGVGHGHEDLVGLPQHT